MPTEPRPVRRDRVRSAAAAWFAAGAAAGAAAVMPAAQALTLDWHPFLEAGGVYDSNVYRLGPGADTRATIGSDHRSDFIYRGTAGAKLAFTQSLQSVVVEGDYGHDQYSRFKALDNDHYRIKGAANLKLASRLTATVEGGKEKFLQSLANRSDDAKGFQRETRLAGTLSYALTPEVSLKPKVDALRLRYTLPDQRDADLDENGAEIALDYHRQNLSAAGLRFRNLKGDYPHRVAVPGEEQSYTQRTLDGYATYIPSGLSQIDLEAGYTERTHDQPGVQDFSGVTGRVAYRRTISGKTYLLLDAYRRLQSAYEIGVSYERETGYDALLNWSATSKTSLALAWQHYEDAFVGSQAVDPANIGRKDIANVYRAGIDYEPAYRFKITPEYRYESHSSTREDRTYRFSAVGLTLKYTY